MDINTIKMKHEAFTNLIKTYSSIPIKKEKKDIKLKKEKTTKRKCPVDKIELKLLNIEGILIDYCTECLGIWFDYGELQELLQKKLNIDNLIISTTKNDKDYDYIDKNCPVCLKNLKKITHSDYHIELCTNCGGIWLDGGEFALLYMEQKEKGIKENILKNVINNYFDVLA